MIIKDVFKKSNMAVQRSQEGRVLASENENLVKCIGYEVTSVDQIIDRSGCSVSYVTSALAQLEIQGLIEAVTGGYMRCAHEREFI